MEDDSWDAQSFLLFFHQSRPTSAIKRDIYLRPRPPFFFPFPLLLRPLLLRLQNFYLPLSSNPPHLRSLLPPTSPCESSPASDFYRPGFSPLARPSVFSSAEAARTLLARRALKILRVFLFPPPPLSASSFSACLRLTGSRAAKAPLLYISLSLFLSPNVALSRLLSSLSSFLPPTPSQCSNSLSLPVTVSLLSIALRAHLRAHPPLHSPCRPYHPSILATLLSSLSPLTPLVPTHYLPGRL